MGKKKIIVACNGFMGHLIPISRIASYLNRKGNYDIIFVVSSQILQTIQKYFPNNKILTVQDNSTSFFRSDANNNGFQFLPISDNWKNPFQKIIEEIEPNLIIADYILVSVSELAKQKNIPVIINFPMRLINLSMFDFPIFSKVWQFCGFALYKNSVLLKLNKKSNRPSQFFQKNLILVNSFYGFDEAVILPPNIKMTGLLLNQQIYRQQLSKDCIQWLRKIKYLKLDIIYVSFGSLIELQQTFINKLYFDLKKTGKAVIWSLRNGKIPQQNQKFYVKNWLPQIQILKLEEVKLVISHCGWGAVTECIYCQKPILCLPAMSDQVPNAKTIQKKNIGLILQIESQSNLLKIMKKARWKSQQFLFKVNDLMLNPSYMTNLRKMKNLSEQGGLQSIHKYVQNALKNGTNHLTHNNSLKYSSKWIRTPISLLVSSTLLIVILINRNRFNSLN